MSTVALPSVPRTDFGKGAARRIRRDGQIPAVIYGSGSDVVHVAIPTRDLDLALRKPRVVFSMDVNGASVLVKPRDIQRDPVKRSLEHIDLVIIDKAEASDRKEMADAIAAAIHAADEAGMDSAAAVQALETAVAGGENPTDAAAHAVSDAEHQADAYSDANVAQAAAEATAAAADAPAAE
ncbi:MAG: 50S ribosomal protein L25 [Candidatus Nanopelagicales bacterium]|nr:50S ribosomal protein L25 [Candidatus Nanopelagicales bacterium]